MKNRLSSSIAVVAFGLLIIPVPVCTFPTCSRVTGTTAGGTVPMKCFWVRQVEIEIGILILCGGVLLVVFESPLTRISVSLITTLADVLGLLVLTLLIGGCEMSTMSCRMTTFPALYVLGALTTIAYAANAFCFWRRNHQSRVKADRQ